MKETIVIQADRFNLKFIINMDTEKLISIIRENIPLWDMRDKKYHQRDVQRKLWAKVADEIGFEVGVVKKKWQGLRDVFRKEINKVTKGKSGDEAPFEGTSTWPHFESLLFLKDVTKPRQLHGSISPLRSQLSPIAPEVEGLNENSNSESHVTIGSQPQENSQESNITNDIPPPPPPNLQGSSANSSKRKKKVNFDEKFLEIEQEKLKLLVGADDSDQQFLLSLTPFLKKVPSHRKLSVRHKLQQVFIEEEEIALRAYTPTQFSSRSSISSEQSLFPVANTAGGNEIQQIIYPTETMPANTSQYFSSFTDLT